MDEAPDPGDTTATVTIPAHFHGPPESGNGGYTCGVAAATVDAPTVQVRLRVPPPLDRPLRVEHRDGHNVLLDGDTVVAEARPGAVALTPPAPVGFDLAADALERFDLDEYTAGHAFPTCFTCGPNRAPGDGLRIFPVPIAGRPELVACPWLPDDLSAGPDGRVRDEILWAALDCPSGMVWMVGDPPAGPAVLGQLAVEIRQRPAVGTPLVVAGWRTEADGRKLHAGSALWNEAGDLLAVGDATWIQLAADQHDTFNAATR